MDFSESASYDGVVPPAIEGTLGIIRSAHEHGSDVKRVIVCSSSLASGEPKPVLRSEYDSADKQHLSDKTWNDAEVEAVEKRRKSGEAQLSVQLCESVCVFVTRRAYG